VRWFVAISRRRRAHTGTARAEDRGRQDCADGLRWAASNSPAGPARLRITSRAGREGRSAIGERVVKNDVTLVAQHDVVGARHPNNEVGTAGRHGASAAHPCRPDPHGVVGVADVDDQRART